jgi:carbamoyl-phosphate synthase large subunit
LSPLLPAVCDIRFLLNLAKDCTYSQKKMLMYYFYFQFIFLFLLQIPRFAFEKFPGSQPILTTQMKSVGETMALGRTFQESFQKAVRSLESGYSGWGCASLKELSWNWEQLKYSLRTPNPERIHSVYASLKKGMSVDEIHELSLIDKWFLTQLKELVDIEQFLLSKSLDTLTKDDLYEVKRRGFSDKQIAYATGSSESEVRSRRVELGVVPSYKRVDTCAAEFEAHTPYMYSSYEYECESAPTDKKKVLILGGGPNRIGQGIEFDYCCCHASFALRQVSLSLSLSIYIYICVCVPLF